MFIYQADLYCDPCGQEIRDTTDLPEGADPNNEYTWDSSEYPKYVGDGDEADSPQYCGGCRAFLGNPLTAHGRQYVAEAIVDGSGDLDILEEWAEFYGLFFPSDDRVHGRDRALPSG